MNLDDITIGWAFYTPRVCNNSWILRALCTCSRIYALFVYNRTTSIYTQIETGEINTLTLYLSIELDLYIGVQMGGSTQIMVGSFKRGLHSDVVTFST